MTTREYPPRPLVGIGIVVLRGDAVLLIRRGRPPAAGCWSLPGGAQRLGETAEHAARRELWEETGLQVGPMHLAAHVDSIHHDAAGRVQYHYTILDFAAAWQDGAPRHGGDALAARFAPLTALAALDLPPPTLTVIRKAQALLRTGGAPHSATPAEPLWAGSPPATENGTRTLYPPPSLHDDHPLPGPCPNAAPGDLAP